MSLSRDGRLGRAFRRLMSLLIIQKCFNSNGQRSVNVKESRLRAQSVRYLRSVRHKGNEGSAQLSRLQGRTSSEKIKLLIKSKHVISCQMGRHKLILQKSRAAVLKISKIFGCWLTETGETVERRGQTGEELVTIRQVNFTGNQVSHLLGGFALGLLLLFQITK